MSAGLSEGQLAEVEAALTDGPKANGYPTGMWTLARGAEVIERITGCGIHRRRPGRSCGSGGDGPGNARPAAR